MARTSAVLGRNAPKRHPDVPQEYCISVTSSNGAQSEFYRRYSEANELHRDLKARYGDRVPKFPRKRLFGNTDGAFLRQRQQELQVWIDGCLLLDPGCATGPWITFLELPRNDSS